MTRALLLGICLMLSLTGCRVRSQSCYRTTRGTAAKGAPDGAPAASATLIALRRVSRDPDRGVRYAAVMALGKAGAPAATLAEALRDPVWCVRQEAGWWLRRNGASALPVLEAALRDGNENVRASAVWALSGFDEAALPLLRRGLQDEVRGVRVEALMAARRLGTRLGPLSLAPLEEVLRARFESPRGELSEDERYEAALALVWATPEAGWDVCELLSARLQREGQHSSHRDEIARALLQAGKAGRETIGAYGGTKWRPFEWSVKSAQFDAERRARGGKPTFVAAGPPALSACMPPPRGPGPSPASLSKLLAQVESEDLLERLPAWHELGRMGAAAAVFTPAVKSAERDERIAAAVALGTARGEVRPLLEPLLKDSNWRVRCAATRAWGMRREEAARLVPFLADDCVPLARAAFEAIDASGQAPAEAVVRTLEGGHYGALYYVPLLFERFGRGGAVATPRLVALLSHDDMNLREAAARCLAFVGPDAAAATPALIAALGDRRLSVVALASLALGSIAPEAALHQTLRDERARVRAYGAFALGWMLGARRGIDQVPYQPRLPVLHVEPRPDTPEAVDLGGLGEELSREETQLLRRALWSSTHEVAYGAAVRLDYGALDAEASERVMELLLPEGQREGCEVDFDKLRSIIGSDELPACITYVARAARTSRPRTRIFGAFHRISRASLLPWIFHLERVEELEAIEGNAEIWMPASYTAQYMRARLALGAMGDPGPRAGDSARTLMRDWLEQRDELPEGPYAWVINDLHPEPADAELLLQFARALPDHVMEGHATEGQSGRDSLVQWAVLRALGRLHDDRTATYLREFAKVPGVAGNTAIAALARRGDGLAAALMARRGREDDEALLILADVSPAEAAAVLRGRVSDETHGVSVGLFFNRWAEFDNAVGARLPPASVLGLEAAVLAGKASTDLLARAAVSFPGCATSAVAEALFEAFEYADPPPLDTDDVDTWTTRFGLEVLAFLHAADSKRLKALTNAWICQELGDWSRLALHCQYRLGDLEHVDEMLAGFEADDDFDVYTLDRVDGPKLRAWLRERSLKAELSSHFRENALGALAHLEGWPSRWFTLNDFPDERRIEVADWIRNGRLDLVRKAHPAYPDISGDRHPAHAEWARLGRLALKGDRAARSEFWSALRAGRYRWIHYNFDREMHSLGRDLSTYPHWISDLDSNCCRVSDGLANDLFEELLGMEYLYGTEVRGFGRPISERVLEWFALCGGALTWSPILDRWIPTPE